MKTHISKKEIEEIFHPERPERQYIRATEKLTYFLTQYNGE